MRLQKWIAPIVAGTALMGVSPQAFAQNFDDPKEFAAAQELLKMSPQGPEGKPWEQNLGGKEVDTSKYKKPGPYRLCFSNAGVQSVARRRLVPAGSRRRPEGGQQVVHFCGCGGQGRQADFRHQLVRVGRQLRYPDRLAHYHGGV